VIVLVIVLGTAAVLALNNAFHKPTTQQASTATGSGSPDDVKQLIAMVGKHIVVNPSEEPTVATIQDANLLRTQNPAFYKDAQNGDRLLIWSDKAVLYSPQRDVLLAVLPVSLPPGSTGQHATNPTSATTPVSTTTTAQAIEQAVIEVRNGTPTAGLGRVLADKLKAIGLTVLTPTDAHAKNYPNTIIIKSSDKPLPETLAKLQATTNAQVVSEPAGEGTMKGDFLVIVGADFQK